MENTTQVDAIIVRTSTLLHPSEFQGVSWYMDLPGVLGRAWFDVPGSVVLELLSATAHPRERQETRLVQVDMPKSRRRMEWYVSREAISCMEFPGGSWVNVAVTREIAELMARRMEEV